MVLAELLARRRRDIPEDFPRAMVEVGNLYHDWEAGRLPVDGGVLDQSAWFIEAMRVLQARIGEFHEEDMARARVGAPRRETEDDAAAGRRMRRAFGGG